ncbi:MAG: glycosyltransferase family 2 protein [Candidatus Omnitrophota bacterium]
MPENIEVSVVLPCLNEENAVGVCIKKIKEVFANDGIKGEIIVADNGSTDRSRDIAEIAGAKVFLEPQGGYGAAYLCGLKQAQGRYIVIADSDNSYDFYDLPKFIAPLKDGYGFVIGSRFKGKICKEAMPWMHRYIGNPILSGICRLFFKTKLTDIHCGMRAFSASAYQKMRLRTLGMEFATEMVVNAIQNNLKICEVPIDYHPRLGKSKLNPLYDAWRHIRFMLLYCPSWLYFIPGLIGLLGGLAILLFLLKGPIVLFGRSWDTHLMVFASGISILSYQVISLGIFAHTFAVNERFLKQDRFIGSLQRNFSLEKGIFFGGIIFFSGFIINLLIFMEWFSKSFGTLYRIRESIFAITLLIIGLQTIFSSFFISLLFLKRR